MAFLLHQLLSETAARYPDREAIAYKDRSITYAALERQSNKVAHTLAALGIEKGDRVGLYFDRGIESIVAACGVLKAGATYVPLDPKSPLIRVSYMIEKCGIKSLLTLQGKLPKIEKALAEGSPPEHIVLMDGTDRGPQSLGSTQLISNRSTPEQLGETAPVVNVTDADIAYILFTSGSTGNPKGVMISHLNSLTFVDSACDFFHIEKEDRLSNIAPLHFDMSVFDIFVAFKAGACVVVIPEAVAIFPTELAAYIAEKRISVWNSVPSALSLLATYKGLGTCDLSSLRLILFAGEVFPLKYLRLLQEAVPGARFCNMYGQTEANTSTYYWVGQAPPDGRGILPIGKALPNYEVFAMDENGNRVRKPGQEGELYVRGSAVALGYWGEIERTEDSFVTNPLRPDLRETIYRTGDLVQLDSDGDYVFLGRKDHMIKSRGYRIELGEIETVLADHEQVKNSVAIAIPDELVGNRIAAVIVPLSKGTMKKEEIVRYCATRLPRYMIPEIIEFRDSLPMTSSGKVDREKLRTTWQDL
jgi:amino acid adenylation domain-containing protein